MTIWILTFVLLASTAGLGYRQGAIRAGFSLLGILFGAVLALPLGHLIQPLFPKIGLGHPLTVWAAPPLLMFVIVLTLFKVAGAIVHKKVEVFYKYKAGDLRLSLWERLNRRTGLTVALCNGAAYLILISWVIYAISYWTLQLSKPDADTWKMKLVNRLGKDLEATGLSKVAAAVDKNPDSYYDLADAAGMVFQSPQLDQRLFNYPGMLDFVERPAVRDLVTGQQFTSLRQRRVPLHELLEDSGVNTAAKNIELVKALQSTVVPDVRDLTNYLATGISRKYQSQPLVGRWYFDVNAAMAQFRKEKPGLAPTTLNQTKRMLAAFYSQVTLVATPGHQLYVKNLPQASAAGGTASQTVQGEWKDLDGKYALTLNGGGAPSQLSAELSAGRLLISGSEPPLAFVRD